MLAAVVLTGHEVVWIYWKGKNSYRVVKAEKYNGTGAVASVDVFEAGALGWYLKPRSEEVDASRRAKGQPQLMEGEAPPH